MKKISFLLICAIATNTYAQNTVCVDFVQIELIDKIKNYPPTELVPYSADGSNWSLMDVKSKKILTKPIIEWNAVFNPILNIFTKNNCDVTIHSDYSFYATPIELRMEQAALLPESTSIATLEDEGFEVDENGQMTAYSKKYKKDSWDSWNISKAIKHNTKYYAILYKQDYQVLINQKGEEQKDFIFKELKITPYKHKNDALLYVNDFKDKHGFITLSGKKILYNKLMKSPFWHNENFGYSLQHNGQSGSGYTLDSITRSGVLDLTTQKWLIEPQEQYKIYNIIYTSSEKIDDENPKDREKSNIYFLVYEDKNGERFVLDINGKPIKPIQ